MNKTLSNAWGYRVAILWFVLFSINTLGTSITVALVGSDWAALDSQSKFMICTSILTNWTGSIIAFVSKAAKKVEDGANPLDIVTAQTGDTTFTKKTDVAVTQTTVASTTTTEPAKTT